jgi:selenocysteine lyase/cysteine desulfurase
MDPDALRADIPALDDGTVYLNTGASGPATGRALAAAREAQRAHETEAHRGNPYPYAYDAYDESREAIADFLGAPAGEVALTNSTADGLSRLASAVDWEPGDAVVRTDLEHPAGVLPWARLGREGVETRVVACPDGRLDREAYAEAVRDARLVCLSSLSWLHGTRLPVRDAVEVAHDAGALVVVDAVQSVGHHPVDVEEWGADAVAAAGHKWLLGVWGSGVLHVRDPDRFAPRHLGYRAVDGDGAGVAYHDGAARFEVGTASLAPHAALREAVATTREIGLDAIRDRMASLTDRLKAGLGDRLVSPREFESGLVAFSVDRPERTVEALADRGIYVRTVEDGSRTLVRASVHAFNTAADVDALLDGIDAVER